MTIKFTDAPSCLQASGIHNCVLMFGHTGRHRSLAGVEFDVATCMERFGHRWCSLALGHAGRHQSDKVNLPTVFWTGNEVLQVLPAEEGAEMTPETPKCIQYLGHYRCALTAGHKGRHSTAPPSCMEFDSEEDVLRVLKKVNHPPHPGGDIQHEAIEATETTGGFQMKIEINGPSIEIEPTRVDFREVPVGRLFRDADATGVWLKCSYSRALLVMGAMELHMYTKTCPCTLGGVYEVFPEGTTLTITT
jgi:hypothetical protein